jgi:GMP synthase PP-ATPase subunit
VLTNLVGLRAVISTHDMTTDFYPFNMTFLGAIATRVIDEVKGVNHRRDSFDWSGSRQSRHKQALIWPGVGRTL